MNSIKSLKELKVKWLDSHKTKTLMVTDQVYKDQYVKLYQSADNQQRVRDMVKKDTGNLSLKLKNLKKNS